MLENPTTQVFLNVTHHKLRQTPCCLDTLTKLAPVRRDNSKEDAFLWSMSLVMVFLRVFRMTFGGKHARDLCAHRAKPICSCLPDGFT